MAAAKDAGLTRIDHLITTHWHGDHFGGMAELARRIPIQAVHRSRAQRAARGRPPTSSCRRSIRRSTQKATHTVAKPGDTIAVAGLNWRIVSAAGATLKTPLSGRRHAESVLRRVQAAGSRSDARTPSRSAASSRSDEFRVAHIGDLTWNKEFDLMCPTNRVGTVDLFIVSHHGQAISNSPQLVHALHPRVAIMNNGTRKGGQPDAMKVLFSSPGLEDLWQLHFSLLSGQEYTVPGMFIANTVDDQPRRRCRSPRRRRRRPGLARRRRRPTTARPTGSRSPRRRMGRSR